MRIPNLVAVGLCVVINDNDASCKEPLLTVILPMSPLTLMVATSKASIGKAGEIATLAVSVTPLVITWMRVGVMLTCVYDVSSTTRSK